MKELVNILCPKWKPINQWNGEDKHAAISFAVIAVLFIFGGLIESL